VSLEFVKISHHRVEAIFVSLLVPEFILRLVSVVHQSLEFGLQFSGLLLDILVTVLVGRAAVHNHGSLSDGSLDDR